MSQEKKQHLVLKNAPIVEALLDIRIEKFADATDAPYSEFAESVKTEYPTVAPRKQFEGKFEVQSNGEPSVVQPVLLSNGFSYASADNLRVLQARQDGYSFSQLKPYKDWVTLREEAKKYWLLYKQFIKPSRVERIVLRYINRIEIPFPINDFNEYFLTWIDIAPRLPQGISGLFFRVVIPHRELPDSIAATVISTFEPPSDDKINFIFDIEVVAQLSDAQSEDDIWALFETIRKFKDDIFFESMTEKALELFK